MLILQPIDKSQCVDLEKVCTKEQLESFYSRFKIGILKTLHKQNIITEEQLTMLLRDD